MCDKSSLGNLTKLNNKVGRIIPDHGIPDHLIEVGDGIPAEIVELSPQQLTLPIDSMVGEEVDQNAIAAVKSTRLSRTCKRTPPNNWRRTP